jgi:hypothetical protein
MIGIKMNIKKIFSIVFLVATIPSIAFADCDWSLGIKPLADGGYEYSKDCNERVGVVVQQNLDLQKAIKADQDALAVADQRTQNWIDTSLKLEDRVQKVDTIQKQSAWLWFGLGALSIIAAGFGAAQVSRIK